MKCPYCYQEESKVTDSRYASDQNVIRRRRECTSCKKRFTTFETVDANIQVKKRDGTYEDFQQNKLLKGLHAACKYTKISSAKVQSISSDIAKALVDQQIKEISTKALGEMVMEKLQSEDVVAYIRFACVYKRFKDIKEILEAIQYLTQEKEFAK